VVFGCWALRSGATGINISGCDFCHAAKQSFWLNFQHIIVIWDFRHFSENAWITLKSKKTLLWPIRKPLEWVSASYSTFGSISIFGFSRLACTHFSKNRFWAHLLHSGVMQRVCMANGHSDTHVEVLLWRSGAFLDAGDMIFAILWVLAFEEILASLTSVRSTPRQPPEH